MAKSKLYEGFGQSFTCAEWARQLNMDHVTLWRNLQKGRTVEEVARWKGIDYKPGTVEPAKRKPRQGARMNTTRVLIEILLGQSGYSLTPLRILPSGRGQTHHIYYGPNLLGVYNYEADILKLSGGDNTKLIDPVAPRQQIHATLDGWELTPATRLQMIQIDDYDE